jgi:hypothetical protein
MADESNPLSRPEAAKPARRQYRKPLLVEYGPISKLTRSGGRTRNEPTAPMRRVMPCL